MLFYVLDSNYTYELVYDTITYNYRPNSQSTFTKRIPRFNDFLDTLKIEFSTYQKSVFENGINQLELNINSYYADQAKVSFIDAPYWVKDTTQYCGFSTPQLFNTWTGEASSDTTYYHCPMLLESNKNIDINENGISGAKTITIEGHFPPKNYSFTAVLTNKYGWADTTTIQINELDYQKAKCNTDKT